MEIVALKNRDPEYPNEGDLRLTESNHRIANNLTLIAAAVRMKASGLGRKPRPMTSVDLALELNEIAARIEAVGMLHRLLSATPLEQAVCLGPYLREICASMASSPEVPAQIVFEAMDDHCLVASQEALLLALMVQELVTNAFKYAHPSGIEGRIEVSCGRDGEGTLLVMVADDGVGLPDRFDPDVDGDHGFRVLRAMADQLGGEIEFESSALGLTCTIRLPPEKP